MGLIRSKCTIVMDDQKGFAVEKKEGESTKVVQNARESLTLRLADQLIARTQEVALTKEMPLGN